MMHHPFVVMNAINYNPSFDGVYSDLIITYQEKITHGHRPDLNEYEYRIEKNNITGYTGAASYDNAVNLLRAAWTGKYVDEPISDMEKLRNKIIDYIRDCGTNNVGMLDSVTILQLEAIRNIKI